MFTTYNAEYERRLRTAFIGCGGHAYRNIYPTFQYAPVDLVAVCDLDADKAEVCKGMFGAGAAYTDYAEMLDKERPEIVFVVLNYDEQGRPKYPRVAMDCMRAGAHVWIEKPPAASSDEILEMMKVSEATGKFVGVGFKKMFFPALVKAQEITQKPEFGAMTSITARYPQYLPQHADRADSRKMVGFLDHVVHPHSILRLLGGPLHSLYVQRHDEGACIASLRFKNGAIGSLHQPWRPSGMAPLEHTEVVGTGANVVVENNTRVTYFRPGQPAAGYGRESSVFGADEEAPLTWTPEYSLGQLYNKAIFVLGYAPEIIYFCQCVLDGTPPAAGNLDDALEMLYVYEAYCQPEGTEVVLP